MKTKVLWVLLLFAVGGYLGGLAGWWHARHTERPKITYLCIQVPKGLTPTEYAEDLLLAEKVMLQELKQQERP